MVARRALSTVVHALMGHRPILPKHHDFTLEELGHTAKTLVKLGVSRLIVSGETDFVYLPRVEICR